MRARLLPLLALLALPGCPRPREDAATLLAEAKKRLGERDARLGSYRFSGTVQDTGSEPLEFSFAYRAPQRMRGTLHKPAERVFSWDGSTLYVQDAAQKRLTTFKDDLPAEQRATLLVQTFGPFTPEGFRVPLLRADTQAKRATHPRAEQAVELSMQVQEGATAGVELTYVLRWPSMDFLGKRTAGTDGSTAEVRVEEEHCDAQLKLCVPQRLTRWVGGQQVGRIELSGVELNPALPNDSFTLSAPEGYDVQSRTLAQVGAK